MFRKPPATGIFVGFCARGLFPLFRCQECERLTMDDCIVAIRHGHKSVRPQPKQQPCKSKRFCTISRRTDKASFALPVSHPAHVGGFKLFRAILMRRYFSFRAKSINHKSMPTFLCFVQCSWYCHMVFCSLWKVHDPNQPASVVRNEKTVNRFGRAKMEKEKVRVKRETSRNEDW